jgi:exopolysaccharide biosynthesis polyprenyl glycosylphosphotransferase
LTVPRRSLAWRFREGERRLLLILGDLIAASLSALAALALWAQLDWFGFTIDFILHRASWVVFLPLAWLVLMVNMYDLRRAANWRQTVRGVLLAAGAGLVLYTFVYFLPDEPGSLPRRGPLYFLALAVTLTLAWRWVYIQLLTTPALTRRVLLVGAGNSGRSLLEVVNGHNPAPFHVVGVIDDDTDVQKGNVRGVPVLGDSSSLLDVTREEAVSDIIVAIPGQMHGGMFQALLDAQEQGIEITRMPVAYEEILGRVPIEHLDADWLLRSFVDEIRVSSLYRMVTRALDIVGALIGLAIFVLLLPWIALAVFVESGRPILFRQSRLGRGGKTFDVLKVRTMRHDAEADGEAHWAAEQDPRATLVGRILRRAHLDEFPQFFNVLKGEMSLVGPRPERPELVQYLEKEIAFYRARLLVKPGLTGWAQVNYGKGASMQGSAEKLEYDLYYIKHRGVLLDIWIVLRTIGSVIGFQGV